MKMMITNNNEDSDDDGSISPPSSAGSESDSVSDGEDEEIAKILSMQEKVQSAIKEVHEFAKYLGMDPEKDSKMLWIAVEAMSAPLPAGWQEYTTPDGQVYFYNKLKDTTQWEHPMDEYHRQLYKKIREGGGTMPKSREAGGGGGGKAAADKKKRRHIFQPQHSESFGSLPLAGASSLPPTASEARVKIEQEQEQQALLPPMGKGRRGGGGDARGEARQRALRNKANALAVEASRLQAVANQRMALQEEEEERERAKALKRARKKAKARALHERLQAIRSITALSAEETNEDHGGGGEGEGLWQRYSAPPCPISLHRSSYLPTPLLYPYLPTPLLGYLPTGIPFSARAW